MEKLSNVGRPWTAKRYFRWVKQNPFRTAGWMLIGAMLGLALMITLDKLNMLPLLLPMGLITFVFLQFN